MAATTIQAYSQSRLLRDLQEVLNNPLPNVVGRPLEENIFEWHVNVRAEDDSNQLSGGTFHVKLLFPPHYPNEGPELYIGTPLPHPNIYPAGSPGQWKLSLWDCIPGFKGWSAAYSAQSILLQLQTFVLREDLQYHHGNVISQEHAVDLANVFTCSECAHKGTDPYPAFHTQEELEGALRNRTKLLVSRPVISQVLKSLKQLDQRQQQAPRLQQSVEQSSTILPSSKPLKVEQNTNVNSHEDRSTSLKGPSHPVVANMQHTIVDIPELDKRIRSKKSQVVLPESNLTVQQDDEEDGWQTVKRGKHCLYASINLKISNEKISYPLDSTPKEEMPKIAKTTLGEASSCQETSASDSASSVSKPALSAKAKASRAARKIRARTMRRKCGKATDEAADQSGTRNVDETADQLETTNVDVHATEINKDELSEVQAMGLFGLLPVEALSLVISKLTTSDLAALSMTCHGMREASEDGFVWKELLHRHFPATSLQAATINDWKHAYMLESSNITSSLQCFHSKVTFDKDVLGYPVAFTVNPRTKCVDYIEIASFDLLSQTAYDEQKVRFTPNNDRFDLLLPLYINQEHFERGLPLLMRTARALCPDMNSFTFKPEMVLSFMPKLLNTMVVLLSGKGISASDRATDGFCAIHRLFLALCDKFSLWKEAEKWVLKFVRSEKARSKEECPSLGDFISLLTVCSSKEAGWENFIRPWVSELFDRGVIWVCKAHPNLVEKLKVSPKARGVDKELLALSWDGRKISLRLAIFFCGFINILARPRGVSLSKVAASYDALYGMASLPMKKRMQEFGKKTMKVDNWPTFFKAIGLQTPTEEYMTGWLRQSWFSSLRKGYHKNNTNFTAIQKHGVSKILLKGETTHLGVDSTVFMNEKWRYEGSQKYLDASCLLYDFDGRFIQVVDFQHLEYAGIRHSGDVIDVDKGEGTHTIHIDLMRLNMKVKELYFTMSGYAGVRLKDIRLPFVQLLDQKTGKELCEYHLEDKNLGEHRSVVMCRLYRNEASKSASWHVEAIGHLGAGSADYYQPIKDWIEQRAQKS
ncbi:hypothetical protein GOP47_0015849 [Adiantum capillus-veneris]|uniref:UBC core domain-containing protein n=1 Tax=Adiantum capillus-veneris TaxID=13818 RepID=A0A9D4ZBK8_ADICA|nr:hypothetical protein GOP47_0015849 [Adiantum capillus-veneris]